MITSSVLIGAGLLLAWANGANDVSKGMATLVGGRATDYRSAVIWGSLWTGAGALAAMVLAQAMLNTFGRGLLAPGTVPSVAAGVATAVGAGLWVAFATRASLPVSTTHAIVGALVGAATVAYGPASVQWDAVATKIVLPLLVSPLIAVALAGLLGRMSPWREEDGAVADCVCAGVEPDPIAIGPTVVSLAGVAGQPYLTVASTAVCEVERPGAVALTIDRVHWISSGAVSFSRGLNDAPKLAVLCLATGASGQAGPGMALAFLVVAAGMTLGSLTGGWRVTRLLAEDVTPMGRHGSFIANVVTALLVGVGAWSGLPMSTTHVSSGGIIGLGMASGSDTVRWGTVRRMLAGWIVTVPVAAMLGAFAATAVRRLLG